MRTKDAFLATAFVVAHPRNVLFRAENIQLLKELINLPHVGQLDAGSPAALYRGRQLLGTDADYESFVNEAMPGMTLAEAIKFYADEATKDL